MAISTFNDLIARRGGDFVAQELSYFERASAPTSPLFTLSGSGLNMGSQGQFRALPSLPSGVTGYIPSHLWGMGSSSGGYLFGPAYKFGTFDFSTGVYTNIGAMPTLTELGVSVATWSPIIVEVTAAISPAGTMTVGTYVDDLGASSSGASAAIAAGGVGSIGIYPGTGSDPGAQSISAVSKATATAGAVILWGMLPLGLLTVQGSTTIEPEDLLGQDFAFQKLAAGDIVKIFGCGITAVGAGIFSLEIVGDS